MPEFILHDKYGWTVQLDNVVVYAGEEHFHFVNARLFSQGMRLHVTPTNNQRWILLWYMGRFFALVDCMRPDADSITTFYFSGTPELPGLA